MEEEEEDPKRSKEITFKTIDLPQTFFLKNCPDPVCPSGQGEIGLEYYGVSRPEGCSVLQVAPLKLLAGSRPRPATILRIKPVQASFLSCEASVVVLLPPPIDGCPSLAWQAGDGQKMLASPHESEARRRSIFDTLKPSSGGGKAHSKFSPFHFSFQNYPAPFFPPNHFDAWSKGARKINHINV